MSRISRPDASGAAGRSGRHAPGARILSQPAMAFSAPSGAISSSAMLLWPYRRVLWRAARNDVAARYAGSLLGAGWAVLTPLLLLAVYGVVYLAIFQVRVPGLAPWDYILYIFSGLVPYLATGEALAIGVGSVVTSRTVLSSTVFPIDLVPAKAVVGSLATLSVGLTVTAVGAAVAGRLTWTAALVPILVLLHAMALLGLLWLLSLLNVVLRDLPSLLNMGLMVMLIASPIAYTPAMVPGRLRPFLLVNPFSYLVTAYQELLVLGELPTPRHSAVVVGGSLLLFYLGGWVFARGKRIVIDYV